jgi:integrase
VDTGARLSEATGLRWQDIQRQEDVVLRVVFKETKNNQPRSIPLTERLMSLLKSMEANNHRHAELVFTYRNSPNQSAVALNNPFTAWKTAVKRAGLNKELRLHDLRHTFASRLVTAGVPIYDVSKLLGHRSLSMTSRYAHLAPEAFFSAIKTLNRPKPTNSLARHSTKPKANNV